MQMITDYQWIDDNSECEALILSINKSDAIAFDSEFERVNTFYPKPALFQLKIADTYYLIDMKKITQSSIFKVLLDNMILHSGSEDLEILHNLNQQLPTQIFDTQVAASLCGFGLHLSYQNIVKEFMGVELSKAHSRSDWMQRPLSDEQLQYALDDVVYLPELQSILQEKLLEQGRQSWFDLLMRQRKDAIINANHVNKTFVKIAKSKRLDVAGQQLLYSLLDWRETMAKQRDKPRNWILKNDEILDIIYKKPQSKGQFIEQTGLYPGFVRHNADAIIDLYDKALEVSSDTLPKFNKLSAEQGVKHAKVKQQLMDACEKLNIPSALVINMPDLKSLIAADKDLSDLEMWQLITQ
ncbi:MAG: HRDC domain-containing protein [Proteobacteria bacterium]|nr:HRDC domain-containing protein [Pseudomonadota bacterium]